MLVSTDENTEATGVVTANVSSHKPSGPARTTERGLSRGTWSLKAFEF